MHTNKCTYQSQYGEIKQSYAYEKFYFKGETKGIALKYVKQGFETYLINKQVIHVAQGQFILVKQEQKFEAYANKKSQNIHGLCIDLNPTTLGTDLCKIYNNPLLLNLPFDCLYFSPLVKQLDAAHSEGHKNFNQLQLLQTLNQQVQTFSDEITSLNDRLSIQTKKINTQRAILVKLFSAKNFIHQHYNQKIKLDKLAQHTGISKYHFLRLFKLCFRLSPQELQDVLRMKKAIELLKNPTSHLNVIAYDLGFNDLGSFSKKFKKQYGVSPSQYRKIM